MVSLEYLCCVGSSERRCCLEYVSYFFCNIPPPSLVDPELLLSYKAFGPRFPDDVESFHTMRDPAMAAEGYSGPCPA